MYLLPIFCLLEDILVTKKTVEISSTENTDELAVAQLKECDKRFSRANSGT